jgi:YVTN family beta-propeller protein
MNRWVWRLAVSFTVICGACTEGGGGRTSNQLILTGIFVVNEGSFGNNTGDISFYDTETGAITNGLFQNANSVPAGDVVQDMIIVDTVGILSVNNSNLLRIVRLSNFEKIKDVPVTQPRLMTRLGTDIYISTWNGDVKVLSTESLSLVDSIVVGDYPEGVAAAAGRVFVANSGFGYSNTVSIIDSSTKTVVGQARVGYGPVRMTVDQGLVYVACSGNAYADPKVPGGIYVLEAISGIVIDSVISVHAGADTLYPTRIAVRGLTGYFINGYAGPIQTIDLGTWEVKDTIAGNFYSVTVNSENSGDENIYATTADVAGEFHIIHPDSAGADVHEVGEFPTGVVFRLEEDQAVRNKSKYGPN